MNVYDLGHGSLLRSEICCSCRGDTIAVACRSIGPLLLCRCGGDAIAAAAGGQSFAAWATIAVAACRCGGDAIAPASCGVDAIGRWDLRSGLTNSKGLVSSVGVRVRSIVHRCSLRQQSRTANIYGNFMTSPGSPGLRRCRHV